MTDSVPILKFVHPEGYGSITIFSKGERVCSYAKMWDNKMDQPLHILHALEKVYSLPFINPFVWLSEHINIDSQPMDDSHVKYWLIAYCKLNTSASYYLLHLQQKEKQHEHQ